MSNNENITKRNFGLPNYIIPKGMLNLPIPVLNKSPKEISDYIKEQGM